ncbi:uncharacterized protein EI90DRAFT_3288275 [Cantharellus anzutake]|uniref:uncharacterized protein n=1 Tax=Cantharellus anzutake TaxID=1750568 RepID=UPI00190654E9|nr:uncharacterized protein EI90DRAFT_3288275 [Cantharellus anzutake]KAF8333984.1 hypothetical protein EI90DRAFT_3288275 [Cantharellus anzutake]
MHMLSIGISKALLPAGMKDGSRRVMSTGHVPCVNNAGTTIYGPLSAIPEFSKASGVKTTSRLTPPTPSRSSLDRQEIPSLIITPPDEDGFSGKILGEDSSCSEDEPPRGQSRLKKDASVKTHGQVPGRLGAFKGREKKVAYSKKKIVDEDC